MSHRWNHLADTSPLARRIGSLDWSRTGLGPLAGWSEALRTLVGLVLASSQPMFLAWGRERTLLYNDAYAPILGDKEPTALGRPFLEVWHEIRDDLIPIVEAAFRGEPVQMDDIALVIERRGFREETHFAFSYTPIRDGTGDVAGFLCACQETTRQVEAERRLRASEARLRRILDGMGEGFGLLDRDFRIIEQNAEALRLDGRPAEAILGRSHWEAYPGSETSEIGRLYKRAMAERVPVSLEHRYRFEDGRSLWLDMRAYPVEEGLAVFWRDITSRKEAEERAAEEAERMRLALDAGAILGVWDWDVPADRFTADPRFARAFGLDAEECRRGLPLERVVETVHPDDRPLLLERIAEAIRQGGPYRHQYRVRRHDGRYYWIEANGRVDLDAEGRALRFPGVLLDIEARRAAEEERDRAQNLLKAFVEAVPGVVYAKDRQGRMLVANRGTTELIGKPPELYLGRTDEEFLDDPEQGRTIMATDRRIMEADRAEQVEELVSLPDGRPAWWLSTKAPLHDASGRVIGLIGSSIDITARREAEERLRRSEETLHETTRRLDAILNNTREAVFLMDHRQHCIYANAAAEKLTGYRFAEMQGRTLHDVVHHKRPDGSPYPIEECPIDRAFPARAQMSGEELFVHRDGSFYPVAFTASPVLDESGEPVGTVIEARNIAEEKARDAALRESEERFRFALEAAGGIGTWDWDVGTDVIHTSAQFARMYGLDPERARSGLPLAEYIAGIHPEDRARVEALIAEAVRTGGEYRAEYRVLGRGGETRWVVARGRCLRGEDGRPSRFPGVTFDITDRKRAEAALEEANATLEARIAEAVAERERTEEALRQSQKMEAVGQLTGGIAHDFNNMLAAVTGSLDLLSRRLGESDERARRYVDAAMEGARRAAQLTQRLLAFSRQQPLRPQPLDANRLVQGMSDLLRHSLGASVHLETVLAGGLWRTHADPNQLESVILNLAVNARDAMPEGGRLTIETLNAHLDSRYASEHLGIPPGQYVCIAVTDTGTGMTADVVARAFDPFFTTKPVGKGTGLGLSQVYGFVKQSGGHVKIYSEPGEGTTVKIYLPRLLALEPEDAAPALQPALPRGEAGEVILVVEDEPAVRRFTVEALQELGYRVVEAEDAETALALLDDHPEIALLFTDVVMPGMNGRKLADEVLRRRPGLPVLFTTGYTRNAVVHNGVLDPGVHLLGKPFTIEDLATKLREVLEAPPH